MFSRTSGGKPSRYKAIIEYTPYKEKLLFIELLQYAFIHVDTLNLHLQYLNLSKTNLKQSIKIIPKSVNHPGLLHNKMKLFIKAKGGGGPRSKIQVEPIR